MPRQGAIISRGDVKEIDYESVLQSLMVELRKLESPSRDHPVRVRDPAIFGAVLEKVIGLSSGEIRSIPGGCTDVGSGTGKQPRNTSWPLASTVFQVMADGRTAHPFVALLVLNPEPHGGLPNDVDRSNMTAGIWELLVQRYFPDFHEGHKTY